MKLFYILPILIGLTACSDKPVYIQNSFFCDGAEEFGISFWDGMDYPKGTFHEFWVVPE